MTTDAERLAEAATLLVYTCNPEEIEDPELDVLPVANALATRDAEIATLRQEIEHLQGLIYVGWRSAR